MNKIISAKNLVKTFSNNGVTQTIIDNLDLEIYENDFTIIMGSSGAGKSTLMYSLSGMDMPTSGSIEFCKEDITKMNADKLAVFRRKNCGFVFQQIYMLDKMSLLDNALTAGLLVNKNKKEVIKRAKELFKKVNLPETTIRKNVNQVSGGEAQRAGIVRAVINKPMCLFADEPTGALNSDNSEKLLDILTKMNEKGQTIVMVTHSIEAARRGDRVMYLEDGVIRDSISLGKFTSRDSSSNQKLNHFLEEMGW